MGRQFNFTAFLFPGFSNSWQFYLSQIFLLEIIKWCTFSTLRHTIFAKEKLRRGRIHLILIPVSALKARLKNLDLKLQCRILIVQRISRNKFYPNLLKKELMAWPIAKISCPFAFL